MSEKKDCFLYRFYTTYTVDYGKMHSLLLSSTSISFNDIARIFNGEKRQAKSYPLINSYRSSGAITELFSQLTSKKQSINIVPIRPQGTPPDYREFADIAQFIEIVKEKSSNVENQKVTILTKTENETMMLKNAMKELKENVDIYSISLAKGLEFDHVVIFNVSATHFKSERDKRILYTAVSRATQTLLITYQEKLVSWIE